MLSIPRPLRLPHQPPKQNHLYKVIYVRHAKVASSTVLDYFGLCNDELKGGRPSCWSGGGFERGFLCMAQIPGCAPAALPSLLPLAMRSHATTPRIRNASQAACTTGRWI